MSSESPKSAQKVRKQRDPDSILSSEGVAEYLKNHPEFFEHHNELLSRIHVPHQSGQAVSLVERQVQILREQNQQLERRMVDLMEVARSNDKLVARMHGLATELLHQPDARGALEELPRILSEQFEADAVCVAVFEGSGLPEAEGIRRIALDDDALEDFQGFLAAARPACGKLREAQLAFLFGDQAKRIKSAALIPLGAAAGMGMLGIGSRREERFTAGMSTDFLVRIAELVEARLV